MKNTNEEYSSQSQNWFQDRYLSIQEKSQRYLMLVFILSGLLALSFISFMILLPLKKTVMEPYVLLIDNINGITSTLTAASSEDFSKHTPVVKYFLSKYVQAHDSYSIATSDTQYNLVRNFSSPDVFSSFQHEWDNPDLEELIQTLGTQGQVAVEVVSITFPQVDIAHVRYIQNIMRQGSVLKKSTWLSTLQIDQLTEIDESLALVNPLGLVVTHYQRVKESENENI